MEPATAFVLDNDQAQRDDIRIRLSNCGVVPICFNDEWICLENIHYFRPAFAVLRPDSRETAIRFVNIAKAIRSTFPIIILSNQSEIESFVRNNWLVDLIFLRYPADEKDFQGVLALLAESKTNGGRPVLIAGSQESQRRIERLPLFGGSTEPVLIQGEPGVGKRLMAKAIHSCATDANRVPVFINDGDISGGWIHKTHQRIHSPSGAGGKILFTVIENIENLSIAQQAQLLLIMETPSANGKRNDARETVRLIALAETDLERSSREGRFRKDLYHRLSVLKMTLPPLRDRRDDVPVLADFFASQYSIRHSGAIFRLPEEVRTVLSNYDWPGNVSELKGSIKRALAGDAAHWAENLSTWCKNQIVTRSRQIGGSTMNLNDDVRRFLENNRDLPLKKAKQRYAMRVESRIMKAALFTTHGNCKKAAKLLNISYKSMLNKAKEYQLV
ncbi:sigma 54-interacting transcriptional regulator [uncultured Desulfosarcina sp.]|uniref:sigma-54-dependent transcriptional regulator n=1 Tax=uncultured Desulfosarcina sp. TaxID=218289 RepID=UPI0029C7CE5D|nr:sigma 54-interacting transcriptional regulator [uncultured Desulfosarcina sp.]